MNKWRKVKLVDVADIKLSSVDKKTKAGERKVRLCNYTDVYNNSYINNDLVVDFMIASCSESDFKRFILKKGQVAITKDSETTDDIGVPTYIAEDFENVVLGYHLSLITPNENKLDGKFLNYWLKTNYAKRYFENNATGSGQRCTLVLDVIKSIPIYLPSLSVQKQIAKVLFDLETKIELNNKINTKLESIAKVIYDYWFVQFDFPDANNKPYKSSGGKMIFNDVLKREIPDGWEVEKIENLLAKNKRVKKILSRDYMEKGEIPIIDQSTKFICGFTDDIEALIETNEPRIIFGDHTRIVKLINFDFARGADGTQVLLSNNTRMPQHLFYHSLLKIDLSNYGYARHFKFLKDIKIIIPSIELAEKFEKLSIVYFEKIRHNIFENQKLAELRDWLLPMLMNGQVRVKETQEHINQAAEPQEKYQ